MKSYSIVLKSFQVILSSCLSLSINKMIFIDDLITAFTSFEDVFDYDTDDVALLSTMDGWNACSPSIEDVFSNISDQMSDLLKVDWSVV